MSIYQHDTKEKLLFSDSNSGWWRWSFSTWNIGWNWPTSFKKGRLRHCSLLLRETIGYRRAATRLIRLAVYDVIALNITTVLSDALRASYY